MTRSVVLVCLLAAGSAEAQSVNLVEDELDSVRTSLFRLGPFYVTPTFRFASGYDSNPLSLPDGRSDITALVGPAARLAVPIKNRAFFDFFQEVDYVYYREQIDLRRFFDVTRVGGGFGGRRFLIQAGDEFRDETRRPTSEFDYPVEQRTNRFDSSLSLALGWRHELRFAYRESRYTIRETSIEDSAAAERLNRAEDLFSVDLGRKLTAKTNLVAEGFFESLDFEDDSRDAESYGARFGFDFSPGMEDPLSSRPWGTSFLAGRFLLGFRNVTPLALDRVDYSGLIGSANVTFGFGSGHRLSGLYSRDVVPSIFDQNWYFVENRWGASFTYQMTERVSVTPGIVLGQNDYPLAAEDGGSDIADERIFDDHTAYRLAVDVRIRSGWTVGVSADYLERESNFRPFTKDRLQLNFNFNFQP